MADIPGVDYAWSHPGGKALKAAGMKFAARYLSLDPSKNLTKAEATDLAANGVSSVVVWETTANRVRSGKAGGVQDATNAKKQATAAGMPAGRPIFFAIDYDAPEADQSKINAYFQGVASVIGLSATGAYGGYWPLSRLKAAKLATWFWQTAGWSGSNRLPGMHIFQPATTVKINGVSCDHDTAYPADYGQWTPGKAPSAPSAPSTPSTPTKEAAVAETQIVDGPLTGVIGTTDPKTPSGRVEHHWGFFLASLFDHAQRQTALLERIATALEAGSAPAPSVSAADDSTGTAE